VSVVPRPVPPSRESVLAAQEEEERAKFEATMPSLAEGGEQSDEEAEAAPDAQDSEEARQVVKGSLEAALGAQDEEDARDRTRAALAVALYPAEAALFGQAPPGAVELASKPEEAQQAGPGAEQPPVKPTASEKAAPKGKAKAAAKLAHREEPPAKPALPPRQASKTPPTGRRPSKPSEGPAGPADRGANEARLPRIDPRRVSAPALPVCKAPSDADSRRSSSRSPTHLPAIEDGARSLPARRNSGLQTVYRPEPPIDEDDEGMDLHLDLHGRGLDDKAALKRELREGLKRLGASKNNLNRVRVNLRADVAVAEIRGPPKAIAEMKTLPLDTLLVAGRPVRPVYDPPLARDLRTQLEAEAAEHKRTQARMKDLERRLRKMDITMAARGTSKDEPDGMARAQSTPNLEPQRPPPKRFGVTESRPVYTNVPSRVPEGRTVRSLSPKRRAGVLPALRSVQDANASRSAEAREAEREKDYMAQQEAEAALMLSSSSHTPGHSSSQLRAEQSRARVSAIRSLESRGMNSWDLRTQEKASRLQEFAVFSESMWDTFYDWRDAMESVT